MSFQSPYCECNGLVDLPESLDFVSYPMRIVSQAKPRAALYEQKRFQLESRFVKIVLIRQPLHPNVVPSLIKRTVDSNYERCYAWHNGDFGRSTTTAGTFKHRTGSAGYPVYSDIKSQQLDSCR